jgi:hypothetical protein
MLHYASKPLAGRAAVADYRLNAIVSQEMSTRSLLLLLDSIAGGTNVPPT